MSSCCPVGLGLGQCRLAVPVGLKGNVVLLSSRVRVRTMSSWCSSRVRTMSSCCQVGLELGQCRLAVQ